MPFFGSSGTKNYNGAGKNACSVFLEDIMITLNLYYKMKPGTKHEFLSKIYSLGIPQATQKENGCIAYDFYASADKDVVLLIEKWENAACLEPHKEQEHFKQLIAIKKEYVLSTDCEKFEQN